MPAIDTSRVRKPTSSGGLAIGGMASIRASACSRFVLSYAVVESRRSGHSHRKKRSASRIESTRITTTTSSDRPASRPSQASCMM